MFCCLIEGKNLPNKSINNSSFCAKLKLNIKQVKRVLSFLCVLLHSIFVPLFSQFKKFQGFFYVQRTTFFPVVHLFKNNNNMSDQIFQRLIDLPFLLKDSQCVLHNDEILICGGSDEQRCYSYHTYTREYKYITSYPSRVRLNGHCVVKLVDNNNNKDSNQITLLSFGSCMYGIHRHTLVMKYVSVWNKSKKLKEPEFCNMWRPLMEPEICSWRPLDDKKEIIIGTNEDYQGVRAVVGGSNNHLLFITYPRNNISVFNLNILRFIKHDILPVLNNACVQYHCFVLKSEHAQEMVKKKRTKTEMLLFYQNTRLLIQYNEYKKTFKSHQLPACKDIPPFNRCAYVRINDIILFFGGYNCEDFTNNIFSSVYGYSIQKSTWIKFEYTLPSPLYCCFGISNKDNTYIHIIGGSNHKRTLSTHMKTKVNIFRDSLPLVIFISLLIKFVIQHWIRTLKIKLGWINDFNKIIIKYVRGFKLLLILQAHEDTVSSVEFSADGRNIVSASYDHTIRIWDAESGKQLQIFRGHTDRVFAARFSLDGRNIVSCSNDGTIRLWNLNAENKVLQPKSDSNKILSVNFSPDGKYVMSGSKDNTIGLLGVDSKIEMKQFSGHSEDVLSTQFSSDGKMILSSSSDKTINLWNVESGKILKQFKGHFDSVTRARFSPDDKFIVSCSLDNTIRIWNIETGKELKILKGHSKCVNDVKYFPDGQTIVSCSSDNTIKLWNVGSGKKIQTLKEDYHAIKCIDVSPNGSKMVSGSTNCNIQIWGY
ncbi:WD repeat-containing protein [Reticulomyxa filosa]|uniref:WD repeat-containing protein n=1 Tax=Reticulomyxa filosa TaxID=46433 RepID=X6LMZ3_RETFI|nr:WD repeat-containing protein [Reticulomyxa filosa]|eukprot:ETO02095.1 WD repeat-containing protein [Reticulomyxa filosa]